MRAKTGIAFRAPSYFPLRTESEDPVPVEGNVGDYQRDADSRQYEVVPSYPKNHLLVPPILVEIFQVVVEHISSCAVIYRTLVLHTCIKKSNYRAAHY